MKRYTAQEINDAILKLKAFQEDKMTLLRIEDMLRQAADDMEREREYEYVVRYFRRGKCVGRSARFYETLEDAEFNNTFCTTGEIMRFFRREVGEWEEVHDDQ